jgi:hypothetical protein
MSSGRNRWFVLFAVLALALPGMAAAQAPVDEVRRSVDDLHRWLGEGANGKQWKAFLKSDQLTAELAKGDQADPAVVAEVLAQYASGTAGLDRNHFQAVKNSLTKWAPTLSRPKP